MLKRISVTYICILICYSSVLVLYNSPILAQSNPLSKKDLNTFTLNYELPGLTSSAGYNYPDENIGKRIYKSTNDHYLVSPLARNRSSSWILIYSLKHKKPAWVFRESIWLIDGDEIRALPVFKDLPKVIIPDTSKIVPEEPVTGIVQKEIMEMMEGAPPGFLTIDGYSAPQQLRRARKVCKISAGAKVHAVAMLQGGDVLIQTETCKGNVWISIQEVTWDGLDFWKLEEHLTIVKPELSGPPKLPKIKKVPEVVQAKAPKINDGHPLLVFIINTQGDIHDWHHNLPKDWQAKSQEQAELILTLRKMPDSVEVCSYIPYGIYMRARMDYLAVLSLKDRTKVVAQTTLKGSEPYSCPPEKNQADESVGFGESPGMEDLVKWLKVFIVGNSI